MKKCASCTKDLPDAALHCVFCGAKQTPASSQPAAAKTVMGYQAADVIEQLRQQNAQPPGRPLVGAPPINPAAAPYSGARQPSSEPPPARNQPSSSPPPARNQPPSSPPLARSQPPSSPPPARNQPPSNPPASHAGAFQPPAHVQAPPYVPPSAANAATLFVPGGGGSPPPQASAGYPAPSSYSAPAGYSAPPVAYAPSPHSQPAPMAPAPAAPGRPIAVAPTPSTSPQYLASQTAARSVRPIEPWKDSLRLVMFIWGILLLAAFATPLSLDPLVFNWDAIFHAEGTAKLPPLIMSAVGLLSIVVAAIPMTPSPRGMIAALLGLSGIFVPVLLHGMPPWQLLVSMIGLIIVVPSLLVRHEYRDASIPRVFVTLGVIAAMLPMVIPVHEQVPLVELFKLAIDAPGAAKIIVILMLGQVALLVLSLLTWLPAPASAGAKQIAWMLIVWPLPVHAALLFLVGNPEMVTKAPFSGAMSWVAMGATGLGGGDAGGLTMMMAGAGIGVAYLAIVGYGGATVIGKNLE